MWVCVCEFVHVYMGVCCACVCVFARVRLKQIAKLFAWMFNANNAINTLNYW